MKRIVLTVAVTALLAGCATTTSPTGRRQATGAVSQAQLVQMGEQAFAEAKAKQKVSSDAKGNAYVRCVVNALVAQLPAEQRAMGWEVALFEDDSANAFALPGGKVGVNTGIFKVAINQDQLAAVVAHEIVHVTANHHDERITRQMGAQLGLGVIGALVGGAYGEGAGQAVSQLGGIGAQAGFLLPNSRQQESEADVVGQRLMASAGFDPAQAVSLWRNMEAAGGSRAPQWMSTHPDPSNRINKLAADVPALSPLYQQARAAGRNPRCG